MGLNVQKNAFQNEIYELTRSIDEIDIEVMDLKNLKESIQKEMVEDCELCEFVVKDSRFVFLQLLLSC